MNCTKALLSVVMDGIKDANMLLDHVEEMSEANRLDEASWFKTHAKKRIDGVKNDFDYVADVIGLREKSKSGDEISSALCEHITEHIEALDNRFNAVR